MVKKIEKKIEKGRALPIEWYFPEQVIRRYATNILVQSSEHEFMISFFEIQQPVLLGSTQEQEAKLNEIQSVRANCVASVIVAAERLPEFIKVLQSNYDTYQSTFKIQK